MIGNICINEINAMEYKACVNIKGIAEKYKNNIFCKLITTHYYIENA